MRTRAIEISGGVQVVVPDSLNLLTPYVLFEQRDWFEDEIGFVRRLLRPGQHAIDVGANYGVYALTMAKIVGPTGAGVGIRARIEHRRVAGRGHRCEWLHTDDD